MANKNQSASYPSKVRAKWYFLAEDTINAFLEAEKYFQFKILGIQNDNGSENNGIPNIIKKIKKNPDTVGILFLRAEENKRLDRKSTRLNSSHTSTSHSVFCL